MKIFVSILLLVAVYLPAQGQIPQAEAEKVFTLSASSHDVEAFSRSVNSSFDRMALPGQPSDLLRRNLIASFSIEHLRSDMIASLAGKFPEEYLNAVLDSLQVPAIRNTVQRSKLTDSNKLAPWLNTISDTVVERFLVSGNIVDRYTRPAIAVVKNILNATVLMVPDKEQYRKNTEAKIMELAGRFREHFKQTVNLDARKVLTTLPKGDIARLLEFQESEAGQQYVKALDIALEDATMKASERFLAAVTAEMSARSGK